MSAIAAATTAELGTTSDAAQLLTVGATSDFRALIASLSQVELPLAAAPMAAAALLPAPNDAAVVPEKVASNAGSETLPGTDLQAAIAAMSTLPWPVSSALPTPDSHGADRVEAKTESVSAATTEMSPRQVTPDAAAVAVVLPQLLRKPGMPTDNQPTQQAPPPTDAAPESAALIAKVAGTGMPLDTDAALTEHRPEDRPESRGNQAVAELRANFSVVMSETSNGAKVERTVSVPVHDARWPAAVANEVRWCAQAGIQSATLRLVPDNLGPIELHVDMQDNKVNVSFAANQLDTRTALEQSIPRLRELLAGSGLTLGQAHVQQETRRNSQFAAGSPRVAAGDNPDAEMRTARIAIGLVDEYA
jgi:flagellar hook-length control protein FliK